LWPVDFFQCLQTFRVRQRVQKENQHRSVQLP
jgi:hypothetical protein